MKKYTSQATKWLMAVTLICGVVLLIGIFLAFIELENIGLPIGLILMGVFSISAKKISLKEY